MIKEFTKLEVVGQYDSWYILDLNEEIVKLPWLTETQADGLLNLLNDGSNKDKLLQDYATELRLFVPMTTEELIKSHKTIRARNSEMHVDMMNAWHDTRQRAAEAQEKQFEYNFISYEKLAKMTLQEIANLIYTEE